MINAGSERVKLLVYIIYHRVKTVVNCPQTPSHSCLPMLYSGTGALTQNITEIISILLQV